MAQPLWVRMRASATRRGRDGSNAHIDIGGQRRERFTSEAKALIRGVEAIELSELLKKPDAHFARMCRAVDDFKFDRNQLKEQLRQISRDKSQSPSRREDLTKAAHRTAWHAQTAAWRADRKAARVWLRVLRLYLACRDWLLPLDMIVRAGFAKTLERQAEKLARHEVNPRKRHHCGSRS